MVRIHHCELCGYQPRASRAAQVLREALGVEAELVRGARGVFEVEVDGRVVARKTLDGFPTEGEILAAVRAALTG